MKRSCQDLVSSDGPDIKRQKLGLHSVSTIDIFQLNADVLRKIFSYCTIPDMWTLAKSSVQFKTLILENNLIGGRIFDFKELSECCHILDVIKMFGQQITRIKIGESDVQYKERTESKLDEIFRLISTYCAVETVRSVDLQCYYGTSIKKRYMNAALPIFRSIESFSLNETDLDGQHIRADYFTDHRAYNQSIDELVQQIIGNAINLTSIRMTRLKVSGRCFYNGHLSHNLKSLSIVQCNIREPEGFIAYLKSAPKLVSFSWDGSSLLGMDTERIHSSDIVYELVAKHIPDLETFHYDQNEFFINERNRCRYVPLFTRPNHHLLKNFGKLKRLGLATMDIECLQLLAEMNQVEELNANLPLRNSEINFDFMKTFNKLETVTFHTHNVGVAAKNHLNYLSALPQLTKCHITVTWLFTGFDGVVVKAVESAKNLSILKISLSIGRLGIDLYSKLLNARLAHGVDCVKPLTLQLANAEKIRYIRRLGLFYRPEVIEIQSVDDSAISKYFALHVDR